ncbi:MAG TPA: RsmG family class I SAM-dependent methyltransferase [Candidatus Binatia bacterium]|nr:RsmG family class I SAM-dependent methyltransferase [Candidatus Binatia bacterium]
MTPLSDPAEIDTLTVGAKELGIDLTESDAGALLDFLDRFYSWNRYGGFTRIPREHGVRLHLLDSLSVVNDLADAVSITDLGTGGGMPGIPLALVLRGSEFTLVESRGRRCTFLREVVRDYGLGSRVRVLEGDAWDLARGAKRFDAVLGRAFLPPRELLVLGSQLIAAGRVIVMGSDEDWIRGPVIADLLNDLGIELRSDRALVLPGGDETRRVFRFERRRQVECFT